MTMFFQVKNWPSRPTSGGLLRGINRQSNRSSRKEGWGGEVPASPSEIRYFSSAFIIHSHLTPHRDLRSRLPCAMEEGFHSLVSHLKVWKVLHHPRCVEELREEPGSGLRDPSLL